MQIPPLAHTDHTLICVWFPPAYHSIFTSTYTITIPQKAWNIPLSCPLLNEGHKIPLQQEDSFGQRQGQFRVVPRQISPLMMKLNAFMSVQRRNFVNALTNWGLPQELEVHRPLWAHRTSAVQYQNKAANRSLLSVIKQVIEAPLASK